MNAYGYLTSYGYRGRLPDGSWMDFPTEEEYLKANVQDLSPSLSLKALG